jgi:hypothetical protein
MSPYEEYRHAFNGEYIDKDKNKEYAAFQQAVASRQFEIELYWKRATYFWTFIAVSFAGFFSLLAADPAKMPGKPFYAFVVGCIGFFFTMAWFFVNKGSKFWQENWENHAVLLGAPIVGPIFSKILHRPMDDKSRYFSVTGTAWISVSKINQWVSFYVSGIWLLLIASTSPIPYSNYYRIF